MESYVVFEYLYRDASNYKSYGEILLQGKYNEDEITFLTSHFESGIFFIPEAIDIPELRSQLYKYGGPNSDDHDYHEFSSIRVADTNDIAQLKPHGALSDFIAIVIKACRKWQSK